MHKFVFCPSLPLTVGGIILIGQVFVGMAGPVHLKIPPKNGTNKKNKLDQKGCGERSGEHSTKMMTITPLVVIILELRPWSSYDDHKMTTRTTMVIILTMTTWSSYGHHITPVFDTLMTMGLPA